MFDEKTIQSLKYYVYALIDSRNNKPFYIGKGVGNRVFDHVNIAIHDATSNDKLDLIRSLKKKNIKIKHIIIRHGLTEPVAFQIEASLIDSLRFFDYSLVNIMNGHHSIDQGLMTSDEIIRLNNAEELNNIDRDAVIININKLYKRGSGYEGIYNAVREWLFRSDSASDFGQIVPL